MRPCHDQSPSVSKEQKMPTAFSRYVSPCQLLLLSRDRLQDIYASYRAYKLEIRNIETKKEVLKLSEIMTLELTYLI